jgi:hypothetical protein
MIKKYKIFESGHEDIDPCGEEDWEDTKLKLIEDIGNIVDEYGGIITMQDLQADCSPILPCSTKHEMHLVETLEDDRVEIIVYGGYKAEYEEDRYNLDYEELEIETLQEIKQLLDNAIENELLEDLNESENLDYFEEEDEDWDETDIDVGDEVRVEWYDGGVTREIVTGESGNDYTFQYDRNHSYGAPKNWCTKVL